jgi:hypothetical protein
MSAVFAIRSPDVVHETIDGETVIIDMASGAYYRLELAAAETWQCLAAGASAADLCAALGRCYEAPAERIEAAVDAFLAELAGHNLIANGQRAAGPAPAPAAEPASRLPFPGLAIHRFTDLQELLFLDPVHEVDDEGWPMRAPQQ